MDGELAKCRFLEAMSLKELGRMEEAAAGLESLASVEACRVEPALRGMALVNLGNLRSEQGSFELRFHRYTQASPLLRSVPSDFLQSGRSETDACRARYSGWDTWLPRSRLSASLSSDYVALGMNTRAAYPASCLLRPCLKPGRAARGRMGDSGGPADNRPGKNGSGGLCRGRALLRESVRQRKTDPKALSRASRIPAGKELSRLLASSSALLGRPLSARDNM